MESLRIVAVGVVAVLLCACAAAAQESRPVRSAPAEPSAAEHEPKKVSGSADSSASSQDDAARGARLARAKQQLREMSDAIGAQQDRMRLKPRADDHSVYETAEQSRYGGPLLRVQTLIMDGARSRMRLESPKEFKAKTEARLRADCEDVTSDDMSDPFRIRYMRCVSRPQSRLNADYAIVGWKRSKHDPGVDIMGILETNDPYFGQVHSLPVHELSSALDHVDWSIPKVTPTPVDGSLSPERATHTKE